MRRIRQRVSVFRLGCHGRHKNCSVASEGHTSLIICHTKFLSTCQCCQIILSSEAASNSCLEDKGWGDWGKGNTFSVASAEDREIDVKQGDSVSVDNLACIESDSVDSILNL